jgi:hypothetical protein
LESLHGLQDDGFGENSDELSAIGPAATTPSDPQRPPLCRISLDRESKRRVNLWSCKVELLQKRRRPLYQVNNSRQLGPLNNAMENYQRFGLPQYRGTTASGQRASLPAPAGGGDNGYARPSSYLPEAGPNLDAPLIGMAALVIGAHWLAQQFWPVQPPGPQAPGANQRQ